MWLIVGDLHFTDRSQDKYRFGIFDWIKQQQEKYPVAATFLAGDITDAKDRHSATLVNKIVSGLTVLKPPVYVDMGNHDYRDHKSPFFKFLNHIQGIKFVTTPTVFNSGARMAVIPHYREQSEFDDAVRRCQMHDPDSFLVHQTFDGAVAESGVRLSGLSASLIESFKPRLGVYAGDVHRPQTQSLVTYVGCPYQVRFGDNFEPRSLLVNKDGSEIDLIYPAPRKWALTVRDAKSILLNKDLYEEDQVKLTIEVTREESIDWKQIKREILDVCKKRKLEIYGAKLEIKTIERKNQMVEARRMDNAGIFEQFSQAENLSSKIKKIGKEILNGK